MKPKELQTKTTKRPQLTHEAKVNAIAQVFKLAKLENRALLLSEIATAAYSPTNSPRFIEAYVDYFLAHPENVNYIKGFHHKAAAHCRAKEELESVGLLPPEGEQTVKETLGEDEAPQKLQFMNWRGQLTDAPEDLPHVIAETPDRVHCLSRTELGRKFQVRYALQVEAFTTLDTALDAFKHGLLHDKQARLGRD